MKLIVDSSALNEWRTCPQKAAYRYKHGFVRAGQDQALDWGTIVHKGMELHYQGTDPTFELTKSTEDHPDRYGRAHTLAIFNAYKDVYSSDNFKVLEVENRFQIPILPWLDICGTTDMLIELNGEKWIMDHKTTYSLYSFADTVEPNAQADFYLYAARQLGLNVKGMIFNGILSTGWTKTRQLPLTDPQNCFMRVETTRSDAKLDEFRDTLIRDAHRFMQDIKDDRFSMNAPKACNLYNKRCPYADLCETEPDKRSNLHYLFSVQPWKNFAIIDKEDGNE